MTTTTISAAHKANRTEAAIKLADHCAAAGLDAEEVAWLPDHRRVNIARAAGMGPLSVETWAEAAKLLGARTEQPADPFAGIA